MFIYYQIRVNHRIIVLNNITPAKRGVILLFRNYKNTLLKIGNIIIYLRNRGIINIWNGVKVIAI